jgi:hypothetical protein
MSQTGRVLASLALLLAGAGAHAGTLTSATWYQVTDVGVLGLPTYTLPMTRNTAQLGAAGVSTASSIAVSLSYPAFSTSFILPNTTNQPIGLAIQITQGGPQAITATPGMAAGSPAIPGTVIVMTAAHAAMGVNQSMFMVGANTIVSVPLSIGRAGAEQLGSLTEGSGAGTSPYWLIVGVVHFGTVSFFAWTPGTLVFSGLTTKGVALPSVVAMGSFNLTPMGGGTVTLVAPSKISIDGPFAQRRTASFTTLSLSFVPEPGTLLLSAAGGVALVLLGRRRSG